MTERTIKDAAYATPDPERALKNLASFLQENPSWADALEENVRNISLLFSSSQFLANYCVAHPDSLFSGLSESDSFRDRASLSRSLGDMFSCTAEGAAAEHHRTSLDGCMTAVREFRIREMLRITFRDILKKADLVDIMLELTFLADVIIEHSLRVVRTSMNEMYGNPADDAFSIIALGKLGGEELNFSSDVDLIFVYGTEKGETSGVRTGQGIAAGRISNHEYYCKVGETFTKFLSLNTEAGFAYRVDLRLRPEGQRGDIALALRGYEMYYESWGRAWERAMLIRARHVAGDEELGIRFREMIRPFVYRKYLDFSAIEEIRRLKQRIDSTFKKGDIKRGYGGIREIEFFAQALQLIYGGKEELLRERSTLKVLHRLLQKALVGQKDYFLLSNSYRFLRTLEHRLQQLNDLQTHTLPAADAALEVLGKKMGFPGKQGFLKDLEKRRAEVRNIYDSLFAEKKEDAASGSTFLDEELSDAELREYLSGAGLNDVEKAVRNIKSIKNSMLTFQTLRGRRLLGEILPSFIESSLRSSAPDTVLNHLQSFASLLSTNEPYMEIFGQRRELIDLLTFVFSQSEYLAKMLMRRPQYLEMIGWQEQLNKSLSSLIAEIRAIIREGHAVNIAVRLLKQAEEIRLGLMFLQHTLHVDNVIRGLSKTAEAVLTVSMEYAAENTGDIAVIGLGKLGGREITFSSDLDVIFVTEGEVTQEITKAAEKFLRMLASYTKEGVAYLVDTRLRPEGSKGPLVSSMKSFRKYYAGSAAFWEFQALLKSRPVAGNRKTGLSFMKMAQEALLSRGREIGAADIRQMRDRILKERAKESEGYDIKLGPGGIEEIEFAVQYLQLANCHKSASLLVQGTLRALDRMGESGIIRKDEADALRDAYLFYRTLESFLRLRGDQIVLKSGERAEAAGGFLGFRNSEDFREVLDRRRNEVQSFSAKYLADPLPGNAS